MDGGDLETTGRPGFAARGGIYWVAPDVSRGSVPGIAHPHVVIQDDVFNRSRFPTVVACAVTTNLHALPADGVLRPALTGHPVIRPPLCCGHLRESCP